MSADGFLAAREILADHERDLENDGVIELAQVETGQFFDLFETVDQRVAVYEQLARGLGNVQIVFEELPVSRFLQDEGAKYCSYLYTFVASQVTVGYRSRTQSLPTSSHPFALVSRTAPGHNDP